MNNDFAIDSLDIKELFTDFRMPCFKFPVKQKKGEAIDFEFEVYEDSKLKEKRSLINKMRKYGDSRYLRVSLSSPKDSTLVHRFYLNKIEH